MNFRRLTKSQKNDEMRKFMEAKDAVEIIKNDIEMGVFDGKNLEAYEMAIEALELEDDNYTKLKSVLNYIDFYQRPSGEWSKCETNHLDFDVYVCSICGREIRVLKNTQKLKNYPFCHCGADMRKGGKE